jgi:putative transposase
MKFVFIVKHRNIWPVAWLCDAMGVSRSGFHAWLNRSPSDRSRSDEAVGRQVKASFLASDRLIAAGISLAIIAAVNGLHQPQ